jgi:hypothetical protein
LKSIESKPAVQQPHLNVDQSFRVEAETREDIRHLASKCQNVLDTISATGVNVKAALQRPQESSVQNAELKGIALPPACAEFQNTLKASGTPS